MSLNCAHVVSAGTFMNLRGEAQARFELSSSLRSYAWVLPYECTDFVIP